MESLQLVARITPTPPRLTAWSDGSTLWLFADILYRPSGWLRRLQTRPDSFEADLLSRRLDHITRCKLLRHYSSAAANPFDHHINADGRQLAELFSRGDIQLFRLPIEDHLMGAPTPTITCSARLQSSTCPFMTMRRPWHSPPGAMRWPGSWARSWQRPSTSDRRLPVRMPCICRTWAASLFTMSKTSSASRSHSPPARSHSTMRWCSAN